MRACPYSRLVSCSDSEVLCKIDGSCISKTAVCDGNEDCSDGADELGCDYTCMSAVMNEVNFQCGGHIAKVNKSAEEITFFDTALAELGDINKTIAYNKKYD